MNEPEPPRNANRILLAAFAAMLAGGGAVAVVVALAKDVLS
jgi:hypothetical protein